MIVCALTQSGWERPCALGQPARSWEKEGTMERYGVVWKKKGRWYSVRAQEIRGSMVSVGLLASDRNALLPTNTSHEPG